MKSEPISDTPNKADPRLPDDFPAATYQQWHDSATALLKGAPFEKKLFSKTYEGIDIRPIYNADDIADLPHLSQLPGYGKRPRGRTASGYRSKPWEVSQELPYSTPNEFNRTALLDLERGQTELNILLDLATLAGRDPDFAKPGEVGACGLSLSTLSDIERAFANIDLPLVSLYFRAGPSALPVAALLFALARKREIPFDKLRGCIELDPLGTLIWMGDLPTSLERCYQEMASLTRFAVQNAPELQTISVQGHPYHDGGASATEELGFVLATAVEYLRELEPRGISLDEAAPRMRLAMSVGSNFFVELAKFRAARLLWARIVEAAEGAEASKSVHIHARTSIWNKTTFDPYVNVLRGTTEAFSAVLAGCDSLHVAPFDEILRVPDDSSRRLARNTQLILMEECDLTKVIDPAGGSYYVEWLTDQIAREAWKIFQEIESAGGMTKAIRKEIPQKKVAATAEARRANVARRRDVIVGTNAYPNASEPKIARNLPDYEKIARQRAQEIEKYRTSGSIEDQTAVLSKLSSLLDKSSAEALETAVEAVLAGASLGEISRVLRHADSAGKAAAKPIRINRAAMGFERIRMAAARQREKDGQGPTVLQLNIGPSRLYRLRADWTSGFFQVGGFTVLADKDFEGVDDASVAAAHSKAQIVVITSTDDKYLEVVEALATAIRNARPSARILVAGVPKDNETAWRKAGVDGFVNVSVNTFEVLESLLTKIGVL